MLVTLQYIIFCLISVITAIFIGLYFYFTRNFKFWHTLGIPYVKPTPFVGNLKECVLMQRNIGEQVRRMYNEHRDKPYVGFFSFDKPSLLIRDLELVKNIMVKDFHCFMNRALSTDEKLEPLFAINLSLLKDELWRHIRTKLNPAFTSAKLKKMFYLVDACCKELADCLHRATADGSPVDVLDTMTRFTTDVIACCGFGFNSQSLKNPDEEFSRHVRNIFAVDLKRGIALLLAFLAPRLKNILRLKFVAGETNNYLRQIVWSTVEYREKEGVVRNDLLDCMMEMRKGVGEGAQGDAQNTENAKIGPNFRIDGDLFVSQTLQFLLAAYETSATTLSYALYELALHPEIQQNVRAEILQVLRKNDGKLTYDSIQETPYTDRVVSETLRKYPIVPLLDRISSSDYQLPAANGNGTVTLPAGTSVYIPVLALHYDPAYYPEPEKFDPDRFTEENKRCQPNYSYLPFGDGPRVCIGMRFAMMEIKAALCHILSRYELAPCKQTPVPIVYDPKNYLMMTKSNILLSFKPKKF